jgi:hypothetical protein
MRRGIFLLVLLAPALAPALARAEPMRMGPEGEYVMGEQPSAEADWTNRPAPMLMPIRTMMPGTWAAPGTWQLMGNAAFIATNPGFSDAYDADLGRTSPYVVADWLMARGRTSSGIFEGMLMLNFEAFTLGKKGWYEIGQAGEGLYDRQHAHQLLHQALLAVHAGDRVTFWGGQGSAPIGPPIFMHRTSNPSPTVPRKHHKGENPHETLPVFGGTFELGGFAIDAAVFSGYEPGPEDHRAIPYVGVPKSYGGRVRYAIGVGFEAQVSAIRIVADEAATQVSASVYGRWVGRFVVDALLDGAADSGGHAHEATEAGGAAPGPSIRTPVDPGHLHDPAHATAHRSTRSSAALAEVAVRSGSLRDVLWSRIEANQRLEPDQTRSSPWWFLTLGYERVAWVDPTSVVGVGLFGETTYVVVPENVAPFYGDRTGVTVTAGMRAQLMMMSDHHHHHHANQAP